LKARLIVDEWCEKFDHILQCERGMLREDIEEEERSLG
jgi:hypothetical protein